MKRLIIFAILLAMALHGRLIAQENWYPKISVDLQEDLDNKTSQDEMFRIVIMMRDQFDPQQLTRQIGHLDKAQKREYVVNELQRLSKTGQQELLKELQQGQKGSLVDNIKTFWIFNGICCSATKDMVQAIAERPDVAYVTKEQEIFLTDGEEDTDSVMSDWRATNQWNVNKVNAPAVWNLGYTGKGIIVAVIDTGVNYNHTDIADNMWDGGPEFPNHGWDFINDDNDPKDDHGHGTHCAGTVSSYGTNGKQCGIAKDAKIMALKALKSSGSSPQTAAWSCIEFAVSHGADVLSMSYGSTAGGYWADRTVMENVLYCGVVASVAAGNSANESENPVPYNINSPGNCPSPWTHPDQTLTGGHSATVTVGSVNSSDLRASSSSIGPATWTSGQYIGNYYEYPWIDGDAHAIGLIKPDIAAPGVNIVSLTYLNNTGYSTKSGTSMATPCVAGVMALLLEANPTLSPLEIDSIIETTAIACEGQTSKNNYYGSGRVNALAAINHLLDVCDAPSNLTATVNQFDVTLNWTAVTGVDTYRIYRNGEMIASSSDNTYIDANAPAGDNTYFVRSNCTDDHASLPSNEVTVTVQATHTPYCLVATEIDTSCQTVDLHWNNLYYTNKASSYYNVGEEHIAAQKYPTSILQSYAGMQIEHIYFIAAHADSLFTIRLYEGDAMTPGVLVHSGSITTSEDNQSVDYVLNSPVQINPNKPLWLTITTTDKLMISRCDNDGEGFLLSYPDEAFWVIQTGYAWSFQIGLGDDDHSYKLYHNGGLVASDINATHYTPTYQSGLNQYQVTAYRDGYESPLSNSIIIVEGETQTNALSLNESDYLYGLSGSILTVSGTLSNSNPEHLVLEDGAQLINDSEGVKATVKKTIQPYTEGTNDGWNLIASPVIEDLDPYDISGLLRNDYDLFAFDQSGVDDNNIPKEWRNYKANDFSIDHTAGYLYANSGETTLSFAGTLAGSGSTATLTLDANAGFSGFNLIGNPYPCNVNTAKSFYVLQYNDEEDNTSFVLGSNPIPPCAAVLVQAQTDSETVSFSKVPVAEPSAIVMQLSEQKLRSSTTLDQARISFEEQCQLTKYTWGKASSTIYIPQNGHNYAVAFANGQNEMPVNFKAAKDGTYTLGFEVKDLELDYLHLIDNMTGADVDLLATPSYTFEGKTTDYESRFRLMFACEDADGDNEHFAFYANGQIVITGIADSFDASLQVVDMMGRIVFIGDAMNRVSTSGMTAGVYVLRLINGNEVKTQKIVIE